MIPISSLHLSLLEGIANKLISMSTCDTGVAVKWTGTRTVRDPLIYLAVRVLSTDSAIGFSTSITDRN